MSREQTGLATRFLVFWRAVLDDGDLVAVGEEPHFAELRQTVGTHGGQGRHLGLEEVEVTRGNGGNRHGPVLTVPVLALCDLVGVGVGTRIPRARAARRAADPARHAVPHPDPEPREPTRVQGQDHGVGTPAHRLFEHRIGQARHGHLITTPLAATPARRTRPAGVDHGRRFEARLKIETSPALRYPIPQSEVDDAQAGR